MLGAVLAILMTVSQAILPDTATLLRVQGPERLCMYRPGVPKPANNPGPGAAPLNVTAQAEAANDATARSEAQLNWSRKVQASFGPAFAIFGNARNAVFTCREAGSYLSARRICSVQAQPCN